MNPQTRKILIIILVVLVICAVIVVGLTVTGVLLLKSSSSTNPTAEPPTVATEPLSAPQVEALDPDIAASMDSIQNQVATIRGLDPTSDVPRRLLTTDELTETVTTEFFKDYTPEDASRDAEVLSLLGLLPKDFDLLSFYKDLYSEQIAGYYDDEVKAMFVVKGSGFTGVERDTYAHEYTHALQDQHFDFDGALGYTEEACQEDSERCAAIQSLIEGDATLTETIWLQTYATQQDYQDIQNFYQGYQSPVYDSAPAYMQSDFMFAYMQGGDFVQALYGQGGFAAINDAFTTVQPVSTEQILHPSRYPSDLPVPVELPSLAASLGADWEETERNVMGEWYTWLILAEGHAAESRLLEELVSNATEGWGGDTYVVLENDQTQESALLVRYVWDTDADAADALAAFQDYTSLRFGKPDAGGVMQGDELFSTLTQDESGGFTWIIAQSQETLAQIQAALR
ncbi:MAG: hypothetical protein WA110_05225 [Anaerolineaceae bacterium]